MNMNSAKFNASNVFEVVEIAPLSDDLWKSLRKIWNDFYEDKCPGVKLGRVTDADWQRWQHVTNQLPDACSVLDVGVGQGQMLAYLTLSKKYESITGIDITTHSRFLSLTDSKVLKIDVTDMSKFDDNSFDIVLCMEVIEHLSDNDLKMALCELRRVAKDILIITVPWDEKLPLPKYHKQHFSYQRLQYLFSNAKISCLSYNNAHRWAMVVEKFAR